MSFFRTIERFIERFGSFAEKSKAIADSIQGLEKRIDYNIKMLKKRLFAGAFEFLFFLVGVVFLVAGAVLFFSRYYPIDAVLAAAGILCLYVAIVFRWVAK